MNVGDLVKMPPSPHYWWGDQVGIIDRNGAKTVFITATEHPTVDMFADKSTTLNLIVFDPLAKLTIGYIVDLSSKVVLQTEKQKQRQNGICDGELGLFIKFHGLYPEDRTRSYAA